jgi:hypothetical protein
VFSAEVHTGPHGIVPLSMNAMLSVEGLVKPSSAAHAQDGRGHRCSEELGRLQQHMHAVCAWFSLGSTEVRALVVAVDRWLGVASATQRQEVMFDAFLNMNVRPHVGRQEKPSVAAHAQEACTHDAAGRVAAPLGGALSVGIGRSQQHVHIVSAHL